METSELHPEREHIATKRAPSEPTDFVINPFCRSVIEMKRLSQSAESRMCWRDSSRNRIFSSRSHLGCDVTATCDCQLRHETREHFDFQDLVDFTGNQLNRVGIATCNCPAGGVRQLESQFNVRCEN